MSTALNLRVPAFDGTLLATDQVVPDGPPVPVVVTRTAYGRSQHLAEGIAWTRRGFAFVVQDVRGRHDSDGQWRPYRQERADGSSLIDYVLAQPWCDGRVAAVGGSYAGGTAWAMAVERPEAVRAVVSTGPSLGLGRVKFDPGSGVLRLAEHATWWATRGDSRTSREDLVREVFRQFPQVLSTLPVADLPERFWTVMPSWQDVVDEGREQYEVACEAELTRYSGAAMHIGGWYDLLVEEVLRLWRLVGSAAAHRGARRLLVGPWNHDFVWAPSSDVGVRHHGQHNRLPLGELTATWLHAALEGSAQTSSADVVDLGTDTWTHALSWPPADVRRVDLHAGPAGRLHTAPAHRGVDGDGDGQRYRYDPLDPFPSAEPAVDRRTLAARTDAARWCSEPLGEDLHLAGQPSAHLTVATDGLGGDWIVRLLERWPDGTEVSLTRGAATTEQASAQLSVVLDALDTTVRAGSTLVMEVTSSDHPFLARHLGTGEDRYRSNRSCPRSQLVRLGGTGITLPVSGRPIDAAPSLEPTPAAGGGR